MSATADFTYCQLVQALEDSTLKASPAEAQGLLCGLLCIGATEAEALWQRELFAAGGQATPPADLAPSLRALAGRVRAELEGEDLALTLVLPEDEAPLRERAEGLYDWARGFILGLGLAGLQAEALSDQAREILDDLLEITRLDLDGLGSGEGGEEDESALLELREFLWVAVRLLHEESGRARA
jgi:uncharacterized protein